MAVFVVFFLIYGFHVLLFNPINEFTNPNKRPYNKTKYYHKFYEIWKFFSFFVFIYFSKHNQNLSFAGMVGFEPTTVGLTGRCSNH